MGVTAGALLVDVELIVPQRNAPASRDEVTGIVLNIRSRSAANAPAKLVPDPNIAVAILLGLSL